MRFTTSTAVRIGVPLLAVIAVTLGLLTPASAEPPAPPVVLHQGVVTRQDIPARRSSEPDTVAEPDVAVSPRNHKIAVAVAQDSRFDDGGAVTISVAWTRNGGASWHHQPVRGITGLARGQYRRASDPVVAFGPDGTAYMSVLLVLKGFCGTAVAVLRSGDGGRTWSKPTFVQSSKTCNYSDDKDWLVVDNSRSSPHRGRLYEFWTAFISKGFGTRKFRLVGVPQAVRWSDDKGRTWSKTSYVTPLHHTTQSSQPMILPNGDIVDTFYEIGAYSIYSARSNNGGRTWSRPVKATNNGLGAPPNVRCCLFAAGIDAVTHLMYVAWESGGGNTDPVYIAWSRDGAQWSSPIRVSRGDRKGVQRVNVDVVARRGWVYVTYGTRTHIRANGADGIVQQQLSVSHNRGGSFGLPTSLGPRSMLHYAATARGYFPGDYMGAAISSNRLYFVWAVSSKPSHPGRYHQVIYGATLRH